MTKPDLDEKDIFNTARRIADPAAREDYLALACAENPDRFQRIHQLLQVQDDADSFLESPHPGLAATAVHSTTEQAGDTIGPYKLLQEIGEGGMGVVYMAEQTEPVRRKVALKLIKAGMDSRQVITRFEVERQALAMMDHVNIARVLDAGTTEQGRPFFVMELVHGVPITKFCDDNHLTPRERLELFVPVCQAIQHAHQKGIIHRDIKPSNVLVTLYDGKPVPKVIDFGVAKATAQPLTEQTLFTQYGTLVGTLEYMSPEQAEMSALGVDTRSDIYSLGVLLYELLTGSTPLNHKRIKAAAYAEVLRLIKEEEPQRPSTRLSDSGAALASISAQRHTEPARLTKLVRGELDWIVMKSLEKDRNRRYETANNFGQDIQRYLADEPVLACPPSAMYRFRKFTRRNKRGLAIATVLALAILVVAGTFGWAIRDREARAHEVAKERAGRELAIQAEVNSALADTERWQKQGNWLEALSAAKRAEGALAGGGDGELRERVRQLRKDLEFVLRLDEIRLSASELKQGRFDYETADRAYAKAFADYGIDVISLPREESAARIRARAGVAVPLIVALDHWAEACGAINPSRRLALTALAQAVDPDPWRQAVRNAVQQKDRKALVALAASPDLLRQPPTSLSLLAIALQGRGLSEAKIKMLRQVQGQYPGDFWLNYDLAYALYKIGPPYQDEALSFSRAALAVRPQSAAAHSALGNVIFKKGNLDEAILCYRKAVELDPKYASPYTTMGAVLSKQGKLSEAIAACHKAIELDPKDAMAYNNLAGVLLEQENLSDAIEGFHKAIKLDPKHTLAYANLGIVLNKQGKPEEAIAAYRKAIECNPKEGEYRLVLGNLLWEQGQWEEAEAAYAQGIGLGPRTAQYYAELGSAFGRRNLLLNAIACFRRAVELEPKYADAHFRLGNALSMQGELDEAVACLHTAIKLNPKHTPAYANLGLYLQKQGKLPEAIDACQKAIELDPKYAHVYNTLGMALHDQEKLDEAIICYQNAIKLDPRFANAHGNLGNAFVDQGRREEALACYQKAIEIHPKHVNAHVSLGNLFYQQKKLDEAIVLYTKATQFDPNHPNAHYSLGVALNDQGKFDEAISFLEKAVELDPKRPHVHRVLGRVLMDQGKPNAAFSCFRRAIELDPRSIAAWQYLGWAEYRLGNWQASLKALKKSCEFQEGGDSGQWIVMSLAHAKLATEKDLTEVERTHHQAEARRLYEKASKQIDGWGPGDSVTQAIREFRAEAAELLGDEKNPK